MNQAVRDVEQIGVDCCNIAMTFLEGYVRISNKQ